MAYEFTALTLGLVLAAGFTAGFINILAGAGAAAGGHPGVHPARAAHRWILFVMVVVACLGALLK